MYNGGTDATLTAANPRLSGVLGSENVTLSTADARGAFADKNVGTGKTVTVSNLSLGGSDAGNYSLNSYTTTANITAKALTATGITAASRVYNGGTDATLTTANAGLSGVISGDAVSLNTATASGAFADKNVGTNKPVTANLSISGTDAGNYTLTQPTGLTADISKATLTTTGAAAQNKTYDRTTAATITGATLVGVFSDDTVTVSGDGSFADWNVGINKPVTANLSISGTDAGNYTLTQPTGLKADISPATLTTSGAAAQKKTYDGTTAATITGASLVGFFSGDTVTVSGGGTFADKNVGTDKAVTGTLTLGGGDKNNYILIQPEGLSADISPVTLTISGAAAQNKVYDRTTVATISGATLVGVISNDNVIVNGVGTFADINVGTSKAVSADFTISGSDAGNYTLVQPTGLTADITAKNLTVTGTVAQNKTYDRTTAATVNGGTLVGVISGDTVSASVSGGGVFDDWNVGTNKAVTASMLLSGGDAGNYTLTQPTGLTANITPAALTTTGATARSKIYNGTTAATITGASLVGVVSGDDVTVSGGGAFANKNIGFSKEVTSALTLGGADMGNYTLIQPAGLTAHIYVKDLTVSGTAVQNKIYDSTTAATITGATLVGVIGDETVTISGGGTFADKNVGTGKAINTAFAISGLDAGNYTLVQPTDLTADITPATLTYNAKPDNRFQGQPNQVFTGTVTGFAGMDTQDTVTIGTMVFTTTTGVATPPGRYAVTGSGLTAVGGNYVFVQNSANASALRIDENEKSQGAIKQTDDGGKVQPPPAPEKKGEAAPVVNLPAGGIKLAPGGSKSPEGGAPSNITIAPTGGQGTSYGLKVTNETVTISSVGNKALSPAGQTLTVVAPDQNVSYHSTATSGNSLTLGSASAPPAQSLPPQPEANAAAATGKFQMSGSDGSVAEFRLTYANGALAIQPLNETAAAMSAAQGGPRTVLVAAGMMAAAEKMGVSVGDVAAVYVTGQ